MSMIGGAQAGWSLNRFSVRCLGDKIRDKVATVWRLFSCRWVCAGGCALCSSWLCVNFF